MGCISSQEIEINKSTEKPAAIEGLKRNESCPMLDSKLPYDSFRDFFTLKNYWKTVARTKGVEKLLLLRFLKTNPDYLQLYSRLKNLPIDSEEEMTGNIAFENVAKEYLKVFDDVITEVETSPEDVQKACNKLIRIGKMHKKHQGIDSGSFQAMEEPFLYMVSETLQDRYTDKAETLFRKFFQFCLKYLVEGYNSS